MQGVHERKEALRRVHERHTALHDEMMKALQVVLIEGPNDVAQAASDLEGGSVDMYFALAEMTEEGMRYNPNFDSAYHKFWDTFEAFKSVARRNIH
ncbi:hypothetical protein NRF20_45945 [Streptomyces sp. R-74717]|uniref:hypothetical protein n=1 Tax=Streptomyces TaxID=1883 RepID=UPI0037B742BD